MKKKYKQMLWVGVLLLLWGGIGYTIFHYIQHFSLNYHEKILIWLQLLESYLIYLLLKYAIRLTIVLWNIMKELGIKPDSYLLGGFFFRKKTEINSAF